MTSNLNQTLQNKYPNLEISVLRYSDAMRDNDSKRIDSEFFKKEYLIDNILISKFDTKNIGDFAFQSCTKLKNITIPKSVKRIGRNAFINCALKSVSIPESVQDIDIDPFDKNVKIIALSGSYAEKWAKDNGYSVIKCKGTTVKLDNKKAKFKIISDDVNDLQVEYTGTTDKKAKTIKIPASVKIDKVDYKVTAIAANALKGRKNIKKIIIKSTSLNKVGRNAIKGIDKKSVIIVPKKKVKSYKKLFNKKTGYKKSIKIKK